MGLTCSLYILLHSYSRKIDHHKSSLEENAILVKELQRQQELIKEMQQDHKSECEPIVHWLTDHKIF